MISIKVRHNHSNKVRYLILFYTVECGKNVVTDKIEDVSAGPYINAPDTGGQVVAGRGSWPWMASLGR